MPGSCLYSNDTNTKLYQKMAKILQVNNRDLFDNVNKNQSWLNNSLIKVRQMRAYKSGEWPKIIDEFEKVSNNILNANHGQNLKDYVTYSMVDDNTWKVLDEYRRRLPSGRVKSPATFQKVLDLLGISSDAVSEDEVMHLYNKKIFRGRLWDLFSELPDDILVPVNRFISLAKDTGTLRSFDFFFRQSKDPAIFLQKYFAHESFAGILNEIYKGVSTRDLKGGTEFIVDEFVNAQLKSLYPEADEKALKKMSDILLIKHVDKQLIDGKLRGFLRAWLAETRILSTISKFTLGWPGAVMMLGQNLFVNVIQHRGLKKGIDQEFYRHKLVDYIINSDILKGTDFFENHKILMQGASAQTVTEKLYRNTFAKGITWFMDKTWVSPETAEWVSDLMKDVTLTGIHNAQDHAMAGPHLRAGIASAALEIFGERFDEAFLAIKKWIMPEDTLNRFIVRAQELGESGNNAFSFDVLRQHILSNWLWSAFSYLQGYHMQRIGELTSSMKKLADAVASWDVHDLKSFKEHLWTTNTELRKAIGVTFDAVHMGFYVDQFYDRENNNSTADYTRLFHEYISSFSANVLTRMFSNILQANSSIEVYKDATGKDIPLAQWIPLMVYSFLDTIPAQMFREMDVAKIVPRLMESWKTNDPALATALRREALEQAFNGNFRYNMPTQENASGFIAIPEQDDIIGSLLLGTHVTNKSMLLSDKLYEVGNIDRIIQWTNWDETDGGFWDKFFKAMPLLDVYFAGDKTANMQWRGLQALQNTDPVLKAMYARSNTLFQTYMDGVKNKNDYKTYATEVQDFYKDMVEFNYESWSKTEKTSLKEQFYGSDRFDSEAKEKLFTKLMEDRLWKETLDSIFEMAGGSISDAGLYKVLLASDAQTPGTGRIVLSYLANKEFSNWATENTTIRNKNDYVDWKNVDNDPKAIEKKEEIVSKYYNLLYLYDKSAYLKVARNQIKNNYPDIYGEINDSQKRFINTLSLVDFVAHREALSGEPSAGNIATILALAGKYITDDASKLAIQNYVADSIDNLDTTLDIKDATKLWVLVANADMLHRLVKDPEFMEKHAYSVVKAINTLYDVADRVSINGSNIYALTNKTISEDQKKSYAYSYWRNYTQRPYNTSNASIQDKVVQSANKEGYAGPRSLYTPTSNSNTRPVSYQTASSPAAKYSVPRPQSLDLYFRIAREWGYVTVNSVDLVKQTVKRFLSWDGRYQTPQSLWYTKRLRNQKPSVRPLRKVKIKKRWPNVQLPLWAINIW